LTSRGKRSKVPPVWGERDAGGADFKDTVMRSKSCQRALSVAAGAIWLCLAAVGGGAAGANAAPASALSDTTATTATLAPRPPASCPRVGFVDMDVVIQGSRAVQGHVRSLEAELEGKRDEIDRKLEEYRRLKEQLDRQQGFLNDEEKARRREELDRRRAEVEDLQYEANRTLRRSEGTLLAPVMEGILAVVEEIARREGFDLVVRGESVIYGAEAVNLTDRVIATLDARGLPNLAAPSPAPGAAAGAGGAPASSGAPGANPTPTPRIETIPLVP